MKQTTKKMAASLLALALLMPTSMISAAEAGTPVGASQQNNQKMLADYSGHWAEQDFQAWVDKGLISGYGKGVYKPDQKITRAEWITLINRVFNLQNEAELNFKDVSEKDAFNKDVKKAVAAGYISGYSDNMLRPGQLVSRQEAAVMLVRLFHLDALTPGVEPKDIDDLPAWSRDAVLALLGGEYITGYKDGNFKGVQNITRAESLRMIDNLAGEIIAKSGAFTDLKSRNVVVSTADVTLKNAVISGNLYLTEGIGEGNVTLDNVKVSGKIFVNGGGEHSVVLKDTSAAGMIVNKTNGKLRISADGTTAIGEVSVQSGVSLEEETGLTGTGFSRVIVNGNLLQSSQLHFIGGFDAVEMNGLGEPVLHISKGFITELTVNQKASLRVDTGTEIKNVIAGVNGTITIQGAGKVSFDDKFKAFIRYENVSPTPTIAPGSPTAPTATPATTPVPTSTPVSTPEFTNVSVHDPSIVEDKGTYYVFGSHVEAAKSLDLLNWTRFTNGYTTPNNVLFGNLSDNLANSFDWAGENDADSSNGFAVWAPDVFWNKDYVNADGTKGAYMMYYCTSSTYIRSAIGYAVSQNIEGPYVYGDTIMYSGFTQGDKYDEKSTVNKNWTNTNIPALINNGTLGEVNSKWFSSGGSYLNSTYPNAIDPGMFYDESGKLWMSYGSWSGGIYVLEVDPATGKLKYPGVDGTTEDGRLIDRYFGTKISGGYGKSGEGPYIVYDEKTDYYYLYVSYGWLGADGGYDIRVFRSSTPDGPYVDAKGQSAVLTSDADHSPIGIKMIGNFEFSNLNAEADFPTYGYVSSGHNSVFYDNKTDKMFNVFHTRFPYRGESHELRVHQMFMNEDNWPLVAPHRYAGETIAKVSNADITGAYQFVNHEQDITGDIKSTVYINLQQDGTIAGSVTGTWELTGDYYANLRMNEVVDGSNVQVLYKGVFVKQWDSTRKANVMAFSALSEQGDVVWGSQIETLSEAQIAANIAGLLSLGDTTKVYKSIKLPTSGQRNSTISWTSSNEAVVSSNGTVTRPEAGSGNATVELTATVTLGTSVVTKTFTVVVLEKSENPLEDGLTAAYDFEGDLNEQSNRFGTGTITGSKVDSTNGTISYDDNGNSGKAAVFNGESGVKLPNGLINGSEYSVSLWLNPDQLTAHTPAFFGAKSTTNWISLLPSGTSSLNETMLWFGSEAWLNANAGMQIPLNRWSNVTFTYDRGTVKVYVDGVQKFSGSGFTDVFTSDTGIFGLGVNYWDTPYKGKMDSLRIYERALTADEVSWTVNGLPDQNIKLKTIDLGIAEKKLAVGVSFTPTAAVLPANAGNKSLAWSSSNSAIASVDEATGKVTGNSLGTAVITALAVDGGGATSSYTVNVDLGEVAYYSFDGNLSDSLQQVADGTVIGDRLSGNTSGTISYGEGISGQGAVFNGSSGVRLPNGLIEGKYYSVSLWLEPSALTPYTTAFFGAQTSDSWISLMPLSNTNKTKLWSGSKWYDAETSLAIPKDQWSHVVFTVENGIVKVYINGAEKFSGRNFPDIFTNNTAAFGLGVNYWDTPFAGKMDELKIYRKALTEAEIEQEFKTANAVIVSDSSKSLIVGDTYQLTVNQDVSWSSSNTAVATVDNGLVTALTAGTAVITATSNADPTLLASTTITVKELAVGFDPSADLITLLDFNGNVNDSSGNNKNGTVQNGRVEYVAGRKDGDQAAQFLKAVSGAPFDNIPVRLPNGLIAGDNAYTVAAWVKWNGNIADWSQNYSSIYFSDTFVSAENELNYFMNMGLTNAQKLYISKPLVGSTSELPVGSWAHVAMTVDPLGETVLYLNGMEIARVASLTRTTLGTNEHFLGGNFWDQNFNGSMDEFRMYNKALTAEQIAELANM